ncbi:MAG: hypothetical protein QM767_30560 [Anaeromyxobacter sp.]
MILLARALDGLQRAQRHLVVVGEDGVHLGLGLEHVLHHREPLGAVEVGGLAGHHLHVRALGLDGLVEALAAIARRGRAGDALQLHHAALAAQQLADVLARQPAAGHVVGRDVVGHVAAARGAVHGDDRDLGGVGGLDGRDHRGRVGRIDQDDLHLPLDQVLDVRDLLVHLVLRVEDGHVHARLLRLRLGAVAERDEERVVERRHREAHGVLGSCGTGQRHERQRHDSTCEHCDLPWFRQFFLVETSRSSVTAPRIT